MLGCNPTVPLFLALGPIAAALKASVNRTVGGLRARLGTLLRSPGVLPFRVGKVQLCTQQAAAVDGDRLLFRAVRLHELRMTMLSVLGRKWRMTC